jgi:hypothetical protein
MKKLFMNLLHKIYVLDNEGIVYKFVTQEFCLLDNEEIVYEFVTQGICL